MNSCRYTHTPSGICTAKGAQKWQNFLSCNIHVAYISHQFENLSLFGPFNVFSFLSEIELLWFAQSVCRTQMRPAEAELSTDFTQYVNLCPQKLFSQVNRTKSRKKEERWSDGPRSCSRHWWQQWMEPSWILGQHPVAPGMGHFIERISGLWVFNYFFVAFALLPLHVTSGSCGAGYCQSSK